MQRQARLGGRSDEERVQAAPSTAFRPDYPAEGILHEFRLFAEADAGYRAEPLRAGAHLLPEDEQPEAPPENRVQIHYHAPLGTEGLLRKLREITA